jgi:hypothetical protein
MEDLSIGRTTLTLNGCGVAVGDDLNGTNPTAAITGSPLPPVNVVGDCVDGGNRSCSNMGDLNTNAAAPVDPLAGKLPTWTWPNPATCGGTGTLTTIGPGCYNNIAPTVTTLLPGDYYITGTVNIDNLTGDDVFLYLTNECGAPCGSHPDGGGFNVVGQNKRLHLTAHSSTGAYPSSPYLGVVVWQVAADTRTFACLGCLPAAEPFPPNNFNVEWSGAIYMPGVDQEFRNAATLTPLSNCALYIVRNLTMENGNGSFNNSGCSALYGGAAFLSIAVTE